jgi:hypothetical protein
VAASKQGTTLDEAEIEGLGFVKAGQKVLHPKFGRDVIASFYVYPDGTTTVWVNFGSHGPKALLLQAMSVSGKGNRLTVCVEQVRTARLMILKSRRESLRYEPETTEKLRELQSINMDESHWAGLSIEEIIGYYELHGI